MNEEKKRKKVENLLKEINTLRPTIVHEEDERKRANLYVRKAKLYRKAAQAETDLTKKSTYLGLAKHEYSWAAKMQHKIGDEMRAERLDKLVQVMDQSKKHFEDVVNKNIEEEFEVRNKAFFEQIDAEINAGIAQKARENPRNEEDVKVPTTRKLSRRDQLLNQIAELKNRRSNISTEKTDANYKQRIEQRTILSVQLGETYKQLSGTSDHPESVRVNYNGAATNFAEAAKGYEELGEERQAAKMYVQAGKLYKQVGDKEKATELARKARFARRTDLEHKLRSVKPVHVVVLFLLSGLFLTPRFTGATIGPSLQSLDFLGLGFFVLFIIVFTLKFYTKLRFTN